MSNRQLQIQKEFKRGQRRHTSDHLDAESVIQLEPRYSRKIFANERKRLEIFNRRELPERVHYIVQKGTFR